MKVYNKLVRDRIPDVLNKANKKYTYHIATDEEFLIRLKDKIIEELEELYENPSVEEMADVFEVLYTLGKELKLDIAAVNTTMFKKGLAKGRFKEKIILEKVGA